MTVAAAALVAAPAHGAIAPTLHMPANCAEIDPTPDFPGPSVWKCDDGIPMAGGLVPNLSGAAAITVPAKYGGDGFTELPPKAGDAATMAGASPADGTVGLDVDITLPDTPPPAGGYPLLFFMHGCCGGDKTSWDIGATTIDGRAAPASGSTEPGAFNERWHYNNLWFASRGYVVVTYTARGFVNNQERGSSGQTQLDSRSFEINDYQHLACQVFAAADGPAADLDDITGEDVEIDPAERRRDGRFLRRRLCLARPHRPEVDLRSRRDRNRHRDGTVGDRAALRLDRPRLQPRSQRHSLPAPGRVAGRPTAAAPARSISTASPARAEALPSGCRRRRSSARCMRPATPSRPTTRPSRPRSTEAFACLQASYPLDNNPACADTLATTLPRFMRERSAYYQNDFFDRIATDPSYRIPVFNSGTLTDPLFPASENRRMVNRLLATVPEYPLQQYYGDYQHFVQNKAKEWGDICDTGGERAGASAPTPTTRAATTTRRPRDASASAPPRGSTTSSTTTHSPAPTRRRAAPGFDVTASLQVCEDNAGAGPVDEPGELFTAPTFEQLAPNTLTVELPGGQQTLSKVPVNPHAANADPFGNLLTNGGECPTETSVAGVGIASYSSDPLPGAGDDDRRDQGDRGLCPDRLEQRPAAQRAPL